MNPSPTLQDFCDAIFAPAPPGAVGWYTSFDSDPADAAQPLERWTGAPLDPAAPPKPNGGNFYISTAAFKAGAQSRRKVDALAQLFFVLDDPGTKGLAPSDVLPPSYKVQTSPSSDQWGYLLTRAATLDEGKTLAELVKKLGWADASGNNAVRYVRPPVGVNTKAKYGEPYAVHATEWNPERRYDPADLIAWLRRVADAQPGADAQDPTDRQIDAELELAITSGASLHDPLIALAARWIGRGQSREDTLAYLRGLMDACFGVVAPDRWQARYAELERYVDSAIKKFAPQRPSAKPIVVRGGGLPEEVAAAVAVLAEHGAARHVYARGAELVRPYYAVRTGFKERQTRNLEMHALTRANLVEVLTALVPFHRVMGGKSGSTRTVAINCPENVARTVLESPTHWDAMPRLDIVASVPLYLGDGRLLAAPGYHRGRGAWLDVPPGIREPGTPSQTSAAAALARVREWLSEFPFAGPLDEAAMLAAMLSAALRPSLDACPGFAFDAPEYGSGKSTACALANIVATGAEPAVMKYNADDEEQRKQLDAAQLQGRAVIVLDNVPREVAISGDVLAMILSQPEREVRRLGVSETYRVSCTQLVTFTGNNLTIGADLTRRLIRVRLLPQGDPVTRTFRRPELLAEARAGRVELLNDLFTVAAYPGDAKRSPLVGYATWCDWVQRPLVALGLPDPVEAILQAIAADVDRADLDAVLHAWEAVYGRRRLKTTELTQCPDHLDARQRRIYDDYLRPALFDVAPLRSYLGEGIDSKALGRWLKNNVDRATAAGRVLRRTLSRGTKRAAYYVEVRPGAPARVDLEDGDDLLS